MEERPVPQAHHEPYRVRFDECGAHGTLRTSAYLRYMQDAASVHSSLAGYTREWYADRRLFWVVRHADLRVDEAPGYGDVLDVSTEVVGFRRIWARRHSGFTGADGTAVADAVVDWVLTGDGGRPVRIPDEISRRFAARLTEGYQPGGVRLGPVPPDAHRRVRVVEAAEVDPLGHLNNAAYVDHVEASIAEAGVDLAAVIPRRVRMDYLVPILIGETVVTRVWRDGERWSCVLETADGRAVARAIVGTG